MSEDAQNLANALRSSSKVQGDWGEMVLASILERAGLRDNEHFFTQSTERNAEGALLRPDVIVEMPGGHRLVIDSKVSLTAFERCVNADDDETRNAALKQHLASVKAHIKALGDKDYAKLYEGVDFTLMFIPLEGAASLALQNDPDSTASSKVTRKNISFDIQKIATYNYQTLLEESLKGSKGSAPLAFVRPTGLFTQDSLIGQCFGS